MDELAILKTKPTKWWTLEEIQELTYPISRNCLTAKLARDRSANYLNYKLGYRKSKPPQYLYKHKKGEK